MTAPKDPQSVFIMFPLWVAWHFHDLFFFAVHPFLISPPPTLPRPSAHPALRPPTSGAQSLSVDVSSYFLPSSFLLRGRAFDPYPGIFWGALRRMNDWTWKRNGQSYSCSLSGAHLPRIQRVQFKKKEATEGGPISCFRVAPIKHSGGMFVIRYRSRRKISWPTNAEIDFLLESIPN